MKNKANECKKLIINYIKDEKTKCENFNFVHLLSFFISFIQKLYGVCEYYTYQITALLPGIFLFWFGAAYELQLASYGLETVSEDTSCAQSLTSGASVQLFWVWNVSSGHTRTTECMQL